MKQGAPLNLKLISLIYSIFYYLNEKRRVHSIFQAAIQCFSLPFITSPSSYSLDLCRNVGPPTFFFFLNNK